MNNDLPITLLTTKPIVMKQMLIILALCPFWTFGQPTLPMKDGKVFYQAIDTVDANKNEIYNRSKIWFVNTFNKARAVLQLDDKDSGIIMGKGATKFDAGNFVVGPIIMYLHYTININIKDGKSRIQVYDIYAANEYDRVTYTPEELLKYAKMNKGKLRRINEDVISTIASYRKAIVSKAASDF